MSMDDDTETLDPTTQEPEPSSDAAADTLELSDLENSGAIAPTSTPSEEKDLTEKEAKDLEAIFDVPVKLTAILGRTKMEISDILKLGAGSIVELDRHVGEAIDVYINNRLIARGEVVLVENKLGITVTEIIKSENT